MGSPYASWTPAALPKPWVVAPDERRPALKAELTQEVAAGHPLYPETQIVPILECAGCDSIVVWVDDDAWAVVHLTRTGRAEEPPWPSTSIFPSMAKVRAWLRENHWH